MIVKGEKEEHKFHSVCMCECATVHKGRGDSVLLNPLKPLECAQAVSSARVGPPSIVILPPGQKDSPKDNP